MGKKPPPAAQAEKIHFVPISQPDAAADCAKRYPNGLEAAREAFGETQQRLSFSLTFFQMALVSDGDDDHAYSTQEMQDVLDAFGRTYRSGQTVNQYVSQLIGLFDRKPVGGTIPRVDGQHTDPNGQRVSFYQGRSNDIEFRA